MTLITACRPINQFCCGCSLQFGVKAILIMLLVQCIFYISTTTANIILQVPSYGSDVNLATQTFNAAFALCGLPFIAIAWYGVSSKTETYVRLFLYYLMVQAALDVAYMLYYLLIVDSCSMLPSALKRQGAAFACGISRIVMLSSVFMVLGVDLYFIFTVWSFTEDLRVGGSGQGLPELLLSRGAKGENNYISEGLFGTGEVATGPYVVNYGSLASAGIGGSTRLFGGKQHDTNYPPKT